MGGEFKKEQWYEKIDKDCSVTCAWVIKAQSNTLKELMSSLCEGWSLSGLIPFWLQVTFILTVVHGRPFYIVTYFKFVYDSLFCHVQTY